MPKVQLNPEGVLTLHPDRLRRSLPGAMALLLSIAGMRIRILMMVLRMGCTNFLRRCEMVLHGEPLQAGPGAFRG